MEEKTKKAGWAAAAVAALVLGGFGYYSQTDGFSGTSENGNSVVETKNEFTGSNHAVVVNPKAQEIVKTGGANLDVVETKNEFTGSSKLIVTPEKPQIIKAGGGNGMDKITATQGSFSGTDKATGTYGIGIKGEEKPWNTDIKVGTGDPEKDGLKIPYATPSIKQVTPTIQKTPGLKWDTNKTVGTGDPEKDGLKTPEAKPEIVQVTPVINKTPSLKPEGVKQETPTIDFGKAIDKIIKELEALREATNPTK